MPSVEGDYENIDPEVLEKWAGEFKLLPDETLADVLARYEQVAARTDALVESIPDLGASHPLPPAPWFAPGATRSTRRVFLHIVAETAQHSGHADIIRESIDGATMYELMAGAEGWPATDWLTSWTPPS